MNSIRAVREHLKLSQEEFAEIVGCSQGNVVHYERGQAFAVERAGRLIDHAASLGVVLTLDQIYGRAPLPTTPESQGA